MSTIQASFGTHNLSNKSIWTLLGHERLHSLRGKAILEEEKRCASLPHEETRITSREIVPAGRIFAPFLCASEIPTIVARCVRLLFWQQVRSALGRWTGTISREADPLGAGGRLA